MLQTTATEPAKDFDLREEDDDDFSPATAIFTCSISKVDWDEVTPQTTEADSHFANHSFCVELEEMEYAAGGEEYNLDQLQEIIHSEVKEWGGQEPHDFRVDWSAHYADDEEKEVFFKGDFPRCDEIYQLQD